MSRKSDTDRQVQQDADARNQGNKQAREESAGRGQQTVVGERGGQEAVEKLHERQHEDEANRPTEEKARADRDVQRVQDQQARNREAGVDGGDVTYHGADGEHQPTTVHPDGSTTTQPPQTTQPSNPRTLAEGGVHPHGETP